MRAVCLAAAVPGLPFRFSCVAAYSPAAPPSYLSPLFARVRVLPASTALLSRCVLCFALLLKKQLRCYRTKTNHRRWLRGSGRRVQPVRGTASQAEASTSVDICQAWVT